MNQQFVFTGNAVAAAGANLKGFRPFPAKAMTTLPTIGGYARATSRKFCIPGLVDFRGASSNAVGSGHRDGDKNLFMTTVTAGIKRLRFQNKKKKAVFHAQNMRVTLHSEHVVGDASGKNERDFPIEIDKDFTFSVHGSKASWVLDDSLQDLTSMTTVEKWTKRYPDDIRVDRKDGYYFYSPVSEITIEGRPPIEGNIIPIAGLGRLHLFEVIRGFNSVRVTFARLVVDRSQADEQRSSKQFEHEEPLDSQIAVCGVASNGVEPGGDS